MLKWLGGGKPDHPLGDEKGLKEALSALTVADPVACLGELRDWVRSVMETEGFRPEHRVDVLRQLDDAAQPQLRRLARDYAANARMPKHQEQRLWGALSGTSAEFGTAWAKCIEQAAADSGVAGKLKAELPLVLVRGLRTLGGQLKWRYMHYEQADAAVWKAVGQMARFAEEKKLLQSALPPGGATPARELARILMLAASSPDSLLPADIELAERVVAHFDAAIAITSAPQAQVSRYCIDLDAGAPPWRMAEPPAPKPGLRYFSAAQAEAKLDEYLRIAERGGVPSDLGLGEGVDPARVRTVLKHLKGCWSATPHVRQHERYAVKHRITVVNGFSSVLAWVQDAANSEAAPESWVTENISAGGIGAVLTSPKSDWLRVGRLVAVQVEGGSGARTGGVIRRCWRPRADQMNIGVRTHAKETFPVKVAKMGTDQALLMNDGRAIGAEALLCVPEGSYSQQVSPVMEFDGRQYLLIPIELVDAGDDFELGRYRVMQQG